MWHIPPAIAGPDDLFNGSVYTRGGMTLQRSAPGRRRRRLLHPAKSWTAEHRTARHDEQFIDLAERLSGKDLTPLFDAWLFQPRRPS